MKKTPEINPSSLEENFNDLKKEIKDLHKTYRTLLHDQTRLTKKHIFLEEELELIRADYCEKQFQRNLNGLIQHCQERLNVICQQVEKHTLNNNLQELRDYKFANVALTERINMIAVLFESQQKMINSLKSKLETGLRDQKND